MTEGKCVGGETPSAPFGYIALFSLRGVDHYIYVTEWTNPFGYCIVLVSVGKWTTTYMTQGKSVGGKAPSAPFDVLTVAIVSMIKS